ncbi:type II toxin-antitoxin system ParD family antitoxin [Shimia sp. R11_0]|uniref:ribbon-helix-helix domain-containing protein n=1 Tax=Shimia sp. R11_0 TaxID=2821096 RepID=UPI001ADBEE36|nr:type II toxin-antitoxin system ParD family antitoxin [Shimia sp. R11_0]MBO9479590.1 type II toxin-antitoxin system ParD family antitoxin [Shimia sp. R11_0]
MTFKTSISLNDAQAEFAKNLVEQGTFPSLSAVAQHGIDLIRQRKDAEQADTETLKALLQSRAQGDFVPTESFRTLVDVMLKSKRRSHGLDI